MKKIPRFTLLIGVAYLSAAWAISVMADSLLSIPDDQLIPILKARVLPKSGLEEVFDQIENPSSNLSLEAKLWKISEYLIERGKVEYSPDVIHLVIVNMGLRQESTDYSLKKLRQSLDDQYEFIEDLFNADRDFTRRGGTEGAIASAVGENDREENEKLLQRERQFYEFFVDGAFNVLSLRGDESDLARIRRFDNVNSVSIKSSVAVVEEYIVDRENDPSLNRGFPGIKIDKGEKGSSQPGVSRNEHDKSPSIVTDISGDHGLAGSGQLASPSSGPNLIAKPIGRGMHWPLILTVVAVVGILILLIRTLLRGRSS